MKIFPHPHIMQSEENFKEQPRKRVQIQNRLEIFEKGNKCELWEQNFLTE